MAKRRKTLPARRQRPDVDDSLLIRSAESLGRMIGSLQRQLDGVAKRVPGRTAAAGTDVNEPDDENRRQSGAKTKGGSAKPSRTAGRPAKGGSKSGVKKVQSTADRTSKRASKSAAAKKTAGRSRSGAGKSAKRSR